MNNQNNGDGRRHRNFDSLDNEEGEEFTGKYGLLGGSLSDTLEKTSAP